MHSELMAMGGHYRRLYELQTPSKEIAAEARASTQALAPTLLRPEGGDALHRLWHTVVEPVLAAARPGVIVEIGAAEAGTRRISSSIAGGKAVSAT